MDTAGRLLRLLGLLQTYRDWTAVDLAERLGITERTVRRDVARLRNLGYPVEAMSGPGGGYRLGAGGKLPPLLLDDDEALAVAVSLRTAAEGTIGGVQEAAVAAMSKLEPVLPPRVRGRLADVSATTVRLSGVEPVVVDPETLALIAGAARSEERIRFDYVARDGRRSERHCEPYRLVFTYRRWYLVAYDRDREAWRTFRLDRISNIFGTRVRFRRSNPPDAEEFVAEGLSIAPYTHRARILIDATTEEVGRFISPTVGRIEAAESDGCILTIGGDELEWIARYVCWLPFPFRVLDPPELADVFHDLGQRLVSAHPVGTPPQVAPAADPISPDEARSR